MEQKIKSIEKGWGDTSTFFSTLSTVAETHRVDEIREEIKVIGAGYYNDLTMTVYKGYKNEKVVFEIPYGSDITLTFFES